MSPSVDHPCYQRVQDAFHKRFGRRPERVVFSPGRINLIGEHTDYNDGYVLPAAIQYGIWFAVGTGDDDVHDWLAMDKNDSISIPLNSEERLHGWQGYLHGGFQNISGTPSSLPSTRCVFTSDLPIGAGLSSSSALTCGFLLAIDAMYHLGNSRERIAMMAHEVERNYIGLQGGIMDQHASLLSRDGHFLFLDCLDRSFKHIPFGQKDEVHLFLINTGVQHELTSTDYNTRASECSQALALLNGALGMDSLRQAMPLDYETLATILPPILLKRILFVQREHYRVQDAVSALEQKDWSMLGNLLYDSHAGLRDDYEVSCPELDFLVAYADRTGDIYGARMMGGGFGGCTINLAVHPPDETFKNALSMQYRTEFGLEPAFISVAPGPGGLLF